jgi:hypothetical protein
MTMTRTERDGFWIAPFGADGNAEGIGFWDFSNLSVRWLEFFREMLRSNPSSFDCALADNLSHVRLKLTAASGAALVTTSYSACIASSALLLIGGAPEKEKELVWMFVESLNRTAIPKAPDSVRRFGNLFQIEQRPLMAVVPWPSEVVDHELVREIGLHLAGAFILESGTGLGRPNILP